jgi:hypothetical protein
VRARFLAAIDWTAAVAPNDRPQSVAALREALGDGPDEAPSAAAPTRAKRRGARAIVELALAASGVRGFAVWTLVETKSIFDAAGPPEASVAAPAPRVVPAPAPNAAASVPPAAIHTTPASAPLSPVIAPVAPLTAPLAPDATQAMAPPMNAVAAPAPAQRSRPAKRPAAPTPPTSSGEAGAAGSRSPAEFCAGRNFIARAICVSRRCQAADAHVYPECVKARRIEEQRQREMDR